MFDLYYLLLFSAYFCATVSVRIFFILYGFVSPFSGVDIPMYFSAMFTKVEGEIFVNSCLLQ